MSRLDRALTWAWGILGRATDHPVFWLLVLGYAVGITVALVIVLQMRPDLNVIARTYEITLPERP